MQKTVLVIGASRGLGLGLAKQFSSEGWQVIATVRNSQQADALNQIPRVSVETLDMNDAASVDALAKRLEGTQLDVLFANAGVAGPQDKPATQATEAEVGQLFFTNAVAPLRLAEQLRPAVNPERGVIVFMSSILGSVETGPGMGMSLYGASKAALNHMTRTFVSELGETGLTVLSMHPGWVKTDMGGDQAPLDVQTSADGMVEQVTLALGRGGHHYLDYKGDQLPW
ncbi:MAG: short-chain dehydrogenase [Pseudomonas sp.]|jgi:NAD(P)-dependent dehydrogenase (short-subunit alcohol dehydrogenase family)|uniref:SDR family oxidoreductase n=1 Tax=Pseudomonadaceae TaxID=135621 RepID=UPI000617FB5B|nr:MULTISPECIES: SDR family oxidoreductase [Pseudomonadaceae]MAL38014.1 short-chain dehydrogenase [Pseudomonas sp.]MBU0950710.1 SDR family oxidoreductase [Gammaproteobacteria bacterium]KJJ61904.1 short-chain dehydrogenase [Pseudomonas sp. 10B238]MAX92081.1 short-chain dehydrogenase [Pseudomonas sp.]MBK3796992.1 SDR family oxidoreductase [Stutzerimonas stutzeri]|tara:strand:+ start:2456 stop:3136 length:681 start_codon:yes stop_codon:yes gene_type:complete